jgi:hypothetical protein
MHTFYIIFWASNENICSLSTPLTKRRGVDREQIFGNQITHRFSGRAKNILQYRELNEHEEMTREFMMTMPLFDNFDSEEVDIIARHTNYTEIRRGEYLFTEGDKGCTIGEMSIIDKTPRSASVIARQP